MKLDIEGLKATLREFQEIVKTPNSDACLSRELKGLKVCGTY
jgi:hypothetical protein